jgi:hypothetical protein
MSLNLEAFLKKHGQPQQRIEFDITVLEKYEIPEDIRLLYQEFGLCSFAEGFLWIINPFEYMDQFQFWIPKISKPLPFLRTAFGDFFYWDGIQISHKNVTTNNEAFYSDNFEWIFTKTLIREASLTNIFFQDIYLEALPRLGAVERDECYGFFPPIAMGGEVDSSKLHRVKLREHLAFLSQL